MTMFFGIIGFVGCIVYFVKSIISAFRKDGNGKKNLKIAIGLFILFVAMAIADDQSNNDKTTPVSSDKPAVSQQYQDQHKAEKKETKKENKKQDKNQLSTNAEVLDKIKVGMTKDDFLNVVPEDVNIEPDFSANNHHHKGGLYKTSDGYVYINFDGDEITDVKAFKTLEEGKEYVNNKSTESNSKEQAKKQTKQEDNKPKVTLSQEEAIEKAKAYLDYEAFSRKGLIDQLKFDKFSEEDATYAVDHINVNWNEQALKKGKAYMNYSSFSRSELIEQLEFDGFTPEQAAYAVNKIGL